MVRASNPSAAACGERKLIPSKVERRGSIGRCCHASVKGCVACFSRTSDASGTVRMLAAPTPRAMVRKVFCEAFAVFRIFLFLSWALCRSYTLFIAFASHEDCCADHEKNYEHSDHNQKIYEW